jgi:hypothetical protein
MQHKKAALLLWFILASASAWAGLDITAYAELQIVPNAKIDTNGNPVHAQSEVRLSPVDFPDQFVGLKANAIYRFTEQYEFRAGSYSGYNWWRNELAKLAGYVPKIETHLGKTEERFDVSAWKSKGGPFWELINFSDTEGVIGPVAAAKLYRDFLAFKGVAMRHADPTFRESYQEWEKAFALASKHGAIVFH